MIARERNAQYPLNAEEMRLAFDQVFAVPDKSQVTDIDDFLAIRVGARPFALRVAELARIEVGHTMVALPGSDPWLMGLANSQGKLISVHSLELALGFDRTASEKTWLAICDRDEPLGLAFDALQGYLRIPRTEIFSTGVVESNGKHDQLAVRGAGELRPVINLPHIVTVIRSRVSSHSTA